MAPSALTSPSGQVNGRVFTVAFTIAVGSLLFGYDTGIIGGALLYIIPEFSLQDHTEIQGLIVSSALFGALVGTAGAGFLSDWLGRRLFLLFSAFLFALGGIVMGLSPDVSVLIVGRSIAGLAVGAASSGVPVLIAEFAPAKHRGRLATLPQLMVSSGILVSYFTAFVMSLDSSPRWRVMLGVSIIPAMIFGGCLFGMPESPRWLLSQGKKAEATSVCIELGLSASDLPGLSIDKCKKSIIEEESNFVESSSVYTLGINDDCTRQSLSENNENRNDVSAPDFHSHSFLSEKYDESRFESPLIFFQKPIFRALMIGGSLQAFQQLCGINAIVYYTPQILQDAGAVHLIPLNESSAAILATILAYSLKIPFILFSMHIMDKVGRRKIMLWSLPIMTVSLSSLSFFFGILPTGSMRAVLSVVAVSLYGCSFVVGLGPIPTIICSEIFPTSSRGKWVGVCVGINFLFNILVSQTFPTLMAWVGASSVFLLYASVCVLAHIFILKFMPETSGMGLEETCRILERVDL